MLSPGQILRSAFAERVKADPGFSLRQFALELKMSSGHLSDVMRGKQHLSPRLAQKIGPKLHLPARDLERFYAAIDARGSHSETVRDQAWQTLARLTRREVFTALSAAQFEKIFHWHYFAVFVALHSLSRSCLDVSLSDIARRTDMQAEHVEKVLKALKRLNLVTASKGGWRTLVANIESPLHVAKPAIRSFHPSMVDSARDAIDGRDVGERFLNSLVLAFDSQRMAAASQRINDFCREFNAEFGALEKADSVYGLAVQFFPLWGHK